MTKGMYSNHFRACKWLLESFKEKGEMTLKTIATKWKKNTDLSGGVEMLPRNFHRCKKTLREDFGIDICCKNSGDYGYYIANPEILTNNNLPEWLLSTLATDEKLRQCMSLMDYIIPEPIPSGEDRLDCVTNAMLVHKKLKYDYQKYESTERNPVELGVCGLILYKRRWYILGEFDDMKRFTYALDRMWDLEVSESDFVMDPSFSVKAYFSEFYGIFNSGRPITSIVLRAFGKEAYSMRDLPIHHSQQEIGSGEGYTDFVIKVRPNNELSSYIESRKNFLKVLSPDWYVEEIIQDLEITRGLYV